MKSFSRFKLVTLFFLGFSTTAFSADEIGVPFTEFTLDNGLRFIDDDYWDQFANRVRAVEFGEVRFLDENGVPIED
jgi:hypothetical protein